CENHTVTECLGNSLYRPASLSMAWVTREALPYYPCVNASPLVPHALSLTLFSLITGDHLSRSMYALREIGRKLGKNWNFEEDPCVGWPISGVTDNVTCCCNCDSMICHVASISLKEQSLPGTLPAEFANLPYLQNIDLTRNFLSGTIPPEWGAMQRLVNIESEAITFNLDQTSKYTADYNHMTVNKIDVGLGLHGEVYKYFYMARGLGLAWVYP
ncbi:probable leucine-rich repeat receptor-like serine/threonine-protein kinase, partial [Tanacetum coccineum]